MSTSFRSLNASKEAAEELAILRQRTVARRILLLTLPLLVLATFLLYFRSEGYIEQELARQLQQADPDVLQLGVYSAIVMGALLTILGYVMVAFLTSLISGGVASVIGLRARFQADKALVNAILSTYFLVRTVVAVGASWAGVDDAVVLRSQMGPDVLSAIPLLVLVLVMSRLRQVTRRHTIALCSSASASFVVLMLLF